MASRNVFSEICSTSTLHGIQYLTLSKLPLYQRIFWSFACLAALCGAGALWLDALRVQEENSVSFTLDTSYLDWKTPFPAISICEIESVDKIFDRASFLYGEDRNMDLDLFIRDIVFFGGTCYTCSSHCRSDLFQCPTDLANITYQVRSKCEELLYKCEWNGVLIACCKWFQPLYTELGLCYTINSLLVPNENAFEKLVCDRFTGPGKLEFYASENIKVFIHAREAVPYINQPREDHALVYWGSILNIRFSIRHIENDPLLSTVTSSQRGCILQGEKRNNEGGFYLPYYSYSACIVECHAKAQLKLCNCTHHLMPFSNNTCDINGLICLTRYAEQLRSLRTNWFTVKRGLVCDCPTACSEPEIRVVLSYSEMATGINGSKIIINMDSLPTVKYKRSVVRTKLDLIVSIGGTVGLFLGASLITIVEIIYLFIRYYYNKFINKNR